MTKAYSYIRFSSLAQGDGRSQKRQFEDCIAYCALHGLDLAQEDEYTFLDAGRSAFKSEHVSDVGELSRFFNLVNDGSIRAGSYLIIESLDRLGREHVKLTLPRFMDLLNKGINIVTLTDERVYTSDFTDMDLFASIMVMSRAHEESSTKARRVGDAIRKKQERARHTGASMGRIAPLWLDLIDDKYEVNNANASTVHRIFDMSIAGYGKSLIAKALNQDGVPSFKGKTWGPSSIDKVLTNRAVLGEYQPFSSQNDPEHKRQRAGDPIENYFPAIVTESIFYAAKSSIEQRRLSKSTKQTKRFNLWQGIAKCASCKAAMHVVNKGIAPKGYTYLVCSNSRKGVCKAKSVRLEKSEKVFKEVLAKVDALPLVQDSKAKINFELNEVFGRIQESEARLKELAIQMNSFPSAALAKLMQEREILIRDLDSEKQRLLTSLAIDSIVSKEDFFRLLDLTSFEGRSRANLLLKRLKIEVHIKAQAGTTKSGDSYLVYRELNREFVLVDINGRVFTMPLTAEQDKRVGLQYTDTSVVAKANRLVQALKNRSEKSEDDH